MLLGILLGIALTLVVGTPIVVILATRSLRRARALERRTRNAERLAEIGAMTGGLAHEIKNPLSTIGLNAQLLAEGISDLPDVDDETRGRLVRRVEGLRREVERLRDTLQDFLSFAGSLHLHRERADLNAVVDELADFFLPQATAAGVHLRLELHNAPVNADIDRALVKQALLNLMLNALQAMQAGPETAPVGELILRTAPRTVGREQWAVLEVIDTGPGISDQTRAKIFTPYFTTKGGGSGLGLPTTRRLIEEHGGHIDVHTELGRGTSFSIHLPCEAPETREEANPS